MCTSGGMNRSEAGKAHESECARSTEATHLFHLIDTIHKIHNIFAVQSVKKMYVRFAHSKFCNLKITLAR